jgi:hypothetical protein
MSARNGVLWSLLVLSVLLPGCYHGRDVDVENRCGVTLGVAFFGGDGPPASWDPNTIVDPGHVRLPDSLPGRAAQAGLVRIEYPGGRDRIEEIGRGAGDPVELIIQGDLCSPPLAV